MLKHRNKIPTVVLLRNLGINLQKYVPTVTRSHDHHYVLNNQVIMDLYLLSNTSKAYIYMGIYIRLIYMGI